MQLALARPTERRSPPAILLPRAVQETARATEAELQAATKQLQLESVRAATAETKLKMQHDRYQEIGRLFAETKENVAAKDVEIERLQSGTAALKNEVQGKSAVILQVRPSSLAQSPRPPYTRPFLRPLPPRSFSPICPWLCFPLQLLSTLLWSCRYTNRWQR